MDTTCNVVYMSDYIDVKPDLRLPRRIDAAKNTYGNGDYEVTFWAVWSDALRQYEVERLSVERTHPEVKPVTGTVLRSVRVQEALEGVLHDAQKNDHAILLRDGSRYEFPYEAEWSNEKGVVVVRPTITVPMKKSEAEELRLLHAARLHAIGMAYGVRGLKLVQDVLGITQRSASRLIDKARERGLLDPRDDDDD